jgi:uncharacterized protein YecE (DUF72 family)
MSNPINWHIGCSGFHYKEWKEAFYPPKLAASKWFEYYCRHFNTLELNVTFYRFPQLKTLQGWHARSPDGFLFAVKAPRLITHYKKFSDTAGLLNDFYGTIGEGLREKLGFVLFQLPPQTAYSDAMLQKIIESMNPLFANTVEFRHESWWRPDVYRQLANNRISFCGHSHPRLPDGVIINTDAVYYRFHGVPDLYRSAYPESKLEELAGQVLDNKSVKSAHIYFNNTAGPAALANARWLINRVQ